MGVKRSQLQNFFKKFFEEKNLEFQKWELLDKKGNYHLINSNVIKRILIKDKSLNIQDLEIIKAKLIKIDFEKGDINLFIRYIAQNIIDTF